MAAAAVTLQTLGSWKKESAAASLHLAEFSDFFLDWWQIAVIFHLEDAAGGSRAEKSFEPCRRRPGGRGFSSATH